MVVHYRSKREAPEAGPCWFMPTLEDELGHFVQDVHDVFVVDYFTAMVAEETNVCQVVLETRYDVSTLYG